MFCYKLLLWKRFFCTCGPNPVKNVCSGFIFSRTADLHPVILLKTDPFCQYCNEVLVFKCSDNFTGSLIYLFLFLEAAIKRFSAETHALQQNAFLMLAYLIKRNTYKGSFLSNMRAYSFLFCFLLILYAYVLLKNLIFMLLLLIRSSYLEVFCRHVYPVKSRSTMPFLGTCDPNAQGAHMEDVFLVELETYNPMLC